MGYLVAVSSRDQVMVHQHFGHTEAFQIYGVEEDGSYHHVETRPIPAVCRMGEHDEGQMERTAEALSDCRYVLSAKIGPGAQAALRARGITPLETTHFIDYAMEKVVQYDRKFRHDRHE